MTFAPMDPEKKARLIEAIRTRRESGTTIRQIAEAVPCSINTVMKYQRQLVKSGEIPPPAHVKHKHVSEIVDPDPGLPDMDDLLERAKSTRILTPDEEMRLLSAIMTDSRVAPQYQVQASRQLAALRQTYAPKESLGPPPPLTEAEQISRLGALMDAVGPDISGKALSHAFPGSTWRVKPQYTPHPTESSRPLETPDEDPQGA